METKKSLGLFLMEKLTNIFVIEGPDNVGKSTLIKWLKTRLEENGFDVTVIPEPQGINRKILLHSPFSKEWDPIAKLGMFFKDRAENAIEHFYSKEYKIRNKVFIYDRREVSTRAYQMDAAGGAELLRLNGIDPDDYFNETVARIFSKIESHFLYLHASYEIIVQRSKLEKDNFESADEAEIRARYDSYERQAKEAGDKWNVIDASQSPEAVAEQAFAIITAKMAAFNQSLAKSTAIID